MTSIKIDPELAKLIDQANAIDKSGVDLSKAERARSAQPPVGGFSLIELRAKTTE
jgi:hypothetical protein